MGTYSDPPYTIAASSWNIERVQRAYSGLPYSSKHSPNPIAKAQSFGLYLDNIT
jgi:hypothetical protein